MVSVQKWAAPEAIATALSTELNSLADGAYSAASAAIDNETGLYQFIDIELLLASLTPATSPYVAVYLLPSVDGTNFVDGGGAVAPPANTLIAVFDLSTSASAKRRAATNILIPPLQFKLVALNEANVAFAASGNTLRYRRHNLASV